MVIGLQPEKFILCLDVSLKRGTDFQLLRDHIEVLLSTEGSKPDSYVEMDLVSHPQVKE